MDEYEDKIDDEDMAGLKVVDDEEESATELDDTLPVDAADSIPDLDNEDDEEKNDDELDDEDDMRKVMWAEFDDRQ